MIKYAPSESDHVMTGVNEIPHNLPMGFRLLNDVVMAEIDRHLTVEQLALDAQYVYMIQRGGYCAVAAHAWLHEPKFCGGRWRCMAPDCREVWVCKSVRRAWKAHRRIQRGLPCPS